MSMCWNRVFIWWWPWPLKKIQKSWTKLRRTEGTQGTSNCKVRNLLTSSNFKASVIDRFTSLGTGLSLIAEWSKVLLLNVLLSFTMATVWILVRVWEKVAGVWVRGWLSEDTPTTLKPLSHYAGNLLTPWWQTMVTGDCHHIFTTIIFYWIKFVQCIFYIEDIVNKYLLTYLLPSVANGRQYVASKISASVNGALHSQTFNQSYANYDYNIVQRRLKTGLVVTYLFHTSSPTLRPKNHYLNLSDWAIIPQALLEQSK